jgi:hypothetical protein
MTFLNYADTVSSPFKWMNMINKAGKLVQPSVASVQSAMADFSDEFNQSNFTIDIIDAPGNDSWPMAYMTYMSVQRNVTTYDCTSIFEILSFVSWVLTNDAYVILLASCNVGAASHNRLTPHVLLHTAIGRPSRQSASTWRRST